MNVNLFAVKRETGADGIVVTLLSNLSRVNWTQGTHVYRLEFPVDTAESLTTEQLTLAMTEKQGAPDDDHQS